MLLQVSDIFVKMEDFTEHFKNTYLKENFAASTAYNSKSIGGRIRKKIN